MKSIRKAVYNRENDHSGNRKTENGDTGQVKLSGRERRKIMDKEKNMEEEKSMEEKLTEEPLAKVIDPERVDFAAEGLNFEENVEYGCADGFSLLLDIMYPKDTQNAHPAVIWVHGGGWSSEELDKRYRPEKELAYLCKKGFVCASIDYRLAQTAAFPAQIQDCREAVRFLKANASRYGIDPERIGAWGESAGGHLVELMALAGEKDFIRGGNTGFSSSIQAAVPWYAPKDLRSDPDKLEEPFNLLFATPDRDSRIRLMEEASPITYVKKNQAEAFPAILLMHGDSDRLVNVEESKGMYAALKEAGCDVQLILIPGQGHGFFDGDEYYQAIYRFFEEKLGTDKD